MICFYKLLFFFFLTRTLSIQYKSDNHSIQPKNFSKNKNQNNAYKQSRLEHELSNTFITNNADSVASAESSKANTETARKVHKPIKQRIVLRRIEVASNQNGNNKTVDGKDTRHDDGDQRLHDEFGFEGANT